MDLQILKLSKDPEYQARIVKLKGVCSPMQQKFAEAYVSEANFSPLYAARAANYKNPDRTGWMLIRVPKVKAYIDGLLEGTEVSVSTLTQILFKQVSFDASKYYRIEEVWDERTGIVIDPETGEERRETKLYLKGRQVWIDIDAIREDGYGPLIKKLKWDKSKGNVEVEFYDAQKALELLGKAKGMFIDKNVWEGDIPIKAYVAFDPAQWDTQDKDLLDAENKGEQG